MSGHRQAGVYLDAKEARCSAKHNPCLLKDRCARYLAELPPRFAILEDNTVWGPRLFLCSRFLPITKKGKEAP